MTRGSVALGFLVALLCGCRVPPPPTQQELESASYGDRPTGYALKIEEAFASILIEPETARFEFDSPEQGWGPARGENLFGWVVWTRVNSKNRFGEFAGWTDFKVLMADDEVVGIYRPRGAGPSGNEIFERLF